MFLIKNTIWQRLFKKFLKFPGLKNINFHSVVFKSNFDKTFLKQLKQVAHVEKGK